MGELVVSTFYSTQTAGLSADSDAEEPEPNKPTKPADPIPTAPPKSNVLKNAEGGMGEEKGPVKSPLTQDLKQPIGAPVKGKVYNKQEKGN